MEKMKKKAFVEVDIIAVVIILILFIILLASVGFFGRTTHKLNEIKQELNSDLFLLNLLRAENNNIEQTIIKDFQEKDFSRTKTAVNSLLEDAFGYPLCWTMNINGTRVRENSRDCMDMSELQIGEIDAKTYLPIIFEDSFSYIEVKFNNA